MLIIRSMIFCLTIVFCLSTISKSDVYTWTDQYGVRHYTDSPPPGQVKKEDKVHGKIWSNRYGMEFVYLDPGTFMIKSKSSNTGANRSTRTSKVTLSKGFQIQVCEVTLSQWVSIMPKKVVTSGTRDWAKTNPDHPACYVRMHEAEQFVSLLNQNYDGGRYDIPTEAQWEYACRAGQTSEFNWGLDVANPNLGNYRYSDDTTKDLKPVRSYGPNKWFIYDMHGNVWEWCREISYGGSMVDPKPIPDKPGLILRGGSYLSPAEQCTASYRYPSGKTKYGCEVGLRVIRIPED